MSDILLVAFIAFVVIAAASMIAASVRLRRVRPLTPPTDAAASFAQLFAQRSIYGLLLTGYHRRIGDRLLTTLVHASRAAILIAMAIGLYRRLAL